MTERIQRAARAVGLTAGDRVVLEQTLGREHELTRAVGRQHTSAIQAIVAIATAIVAASTLAADLPIGALALGVAVVVAIAFLLAWAHARRVVRDLTLKLIATDADPPALLVVARERRRLSAPRFRRSLARTLERDLRDAQDWHRLPRNARPLPGVRCLRELVPEVSAVVALLRSDLVSVRGVAVAARLVFDGWDSPLNFGDVDAVREELNRIRYLLEASQETEPVPLRAAA